MYTPISLEVTQVEVETSQETITVENTPIGFYIETNTASITLTEEQLEAIYYSYNKLKTLRKYNNEPQED